MKKKINELKNCKRIAIMGGTFDPIHYGHLVAAESVLHEFKMDKVLFIPTGSPALKQDKKVTSSEHRYLMTALAVASNPFFDVSRIEIDRKGVTYTIDTIRELREITENKSEIYFITGADAINEILKWKSFSELLTLCNFIAVTRPGYDYTNINSLLKTLGIEKKVKLFFHEVPALSISSTDLRRRVKSNEPIKYLLPEEVENYIYKFGFYKENNVDKLIDEKIKSVLSKDRYKHSIGVAEEAKKLAKLYGVDENKAYTAGLVHDIAKELALTEVKQACDNYNIKVSDVMAKQPYLLHGVIGSKMAKDYFKIKDKDILNAVKYHTTGRKKMSPLEKVIFIADAIEPNRKNYDGLEETKKLAYENLDDAIIFFLEKNISYNENKGVIVHNSSRKALKHLTKSKSDISTNKTL